MRPVPLAIAVLWLAGCLMPAAAGPDLTFEERIEVRRVRVPVRLEPREKGSCEILDPSWVRVAEDGLEVPALQLERSRLDTVHAILLDTSESMIPRLRKATKAVERYVSSLPDGEALFFGTFDDHLRLRVARTSDPERVRDALRSIRTQQHTVLWESVRRMVDFLGMASERSVLILVSDGCDSRERSPSAVREVIDQASRTENLTVFAIGIDLPGSCRESPIRDRPGVVLDSLSRETGGKFFAIRGVRELEEVLPQIRERLEEEGHVTYEPVPFGEGPRDQADRQDHRWRKVKLRTDPDAPCAVSIAGSSLRYEGLDRAFLGGGPASDETTTDSLAWDPERGALTGEWDDVLLDSGQLYAPAAYEEKNKFRLRMVDEPETGTRNVHLLLPPFEQVVGGQGRPEDAILFALLNGEAAGTWRETPFLVNGTTLLGHRGSLAHGLYSRPDYRAWAFERIRQRRLERIARLYPDTSEAAEGPMAAVLAGDTWSPDDRELQESLATWLGDVPALDLAVAVESRLAAMTLAREGPMTLSRAETSWKRLRRWLLPAVEVRTLGLLVPAFDPSFEIVGFYRIVLPYDPNVFPPPGLLPPAPYGLRVLSWMDSGPGVPDGILDRFRLRTFRYEETGRRELRDVQKAAAKGGRGIRPLLPEAWRVAVLEFDLADGSGPGPVVRGYFSAENPVDPETVLFEAVVVTGGGAEALRPAEGHLDGPSVIVK